jgi:hypothetical protein
MNAAAEFKVRFGEIARTVIYSDKEGAILFCFDVVPAAEPSKRKWTVSLGRQALSEDGKAPVCSLVPKARIDAALESTKEFLLSCGYEVRVDSA